MCVSCCDVPPADSGSNQNESTLDAIVATTRIETAKTPAAARKTLTLSNQRTDDKILSTLWESQQDRTDGSVRLIVSVWYDKRGI